MNESISQLNDRIKWGMKLPTREEVDWVASELLKSPSRPDVYKGLLVIGFMKAKRHRRVLEYYLYSQDDVFVSRALSMIWQYWEDYDLYRDFTIDLIRGVAWDAVELARTMAIYAVHDHIKTCQDVDLIKEIFCAYLTSEDRQVQLAAYIVLSSLLELSPEEREGPPRKPIIRSGVVEKIEAFVNNLPGKK